MSVSRKGVDVDISESTDSASQTEGLELKGNEVRELLMRLMGGGARRDRKEESSRKCWMEGVWGPGRRGW